MAEIIAKNILDKTQFLPIQYNDSTNLKTLLAIFLAQVQELEDANIGLGTVSTDIDLAEGYQLDIIGKLVGADREGRSDADYRLFIRFRITVNTGSGTPEDVFALLSFTTGANSVHIFEHYPASVYFYLDGVIDPSLALRFQTESVLPAGVSLGYIGHSNNPLVFTPYTQEYLTSDLVDNNSNNIAKQDNEFFCVTIPIQTDSIIQKGWLAETLILAIFELADDIGNSIVTDTGDILELNTFDVGASDIYGVLAETLTL